MEEKEGSFPYRVTIYYTEPLFCQTRNKDPDTLFSAVFEVEAEHEQEAVDKARAEFSRITKESMVKWERRIMRSEARRITG